MNYKEIESDEIEIDLVDLGYRLLSRLHHIILCFMIGAVLLNAYSYFLIEPTYESTAKIYVVSSSTDSVVDLTDLNIGTSLTSDYQELVMSYPVLSRVIKKLDLEMETEDLAKMVSLSNPSDTRILNLTATSTDKEMAQKIANTLTEVAVEYLPETMSTPAPNIAQEAQLPKRKANPSYLKYTMIGALLGALLYCAWVVVDYIMDDTIHTAEEMEKYFGMVPLTSISKNEEFAEDEPKKKRRFFKRKRR